MDEHVPSDGGSAANAAKLAKKILCFVGVVGSRHNRVDENKVAAALELTQRGSFASRF